MNRKAHKDWHFAEDNTLAKQIGDFVKHHRMSQNKSQDELASSAGLSRTTLSMLERGQGVTLGSLLRVLRILDQLHVMDQFVVEPALSPIALAKLETKTRERASPNILKGKAGEDTKSTW